MKKKSLLAKILIGILIFISILIIGLYCFVKFFLGNIIDFSKPIYSDKKVITTEFGDEFTVWRYEWNFPDQEISIGVNINNESIFYESALSNYLSHYDYENDIRDNWDEIIRAYGNGDIRVYQFNWGFIYSSDGWKTYSSKAKHEYTYSPEEEFNNVCEALVKESDII